jgi:hypothetical protein
MRSPTEVARFFSIREFRVLRVPLLLLLFVKQVMKATAMPLLDDGRE